MKYILSLSSQKDGEWSTIGTKSADGTVIGLSEGQSIPLKTSRSAGDGIVVDFEGWSPGTVTVQDGRDSSPKLIPFEWNGNPITIGFVVDQRYAYTIELSSAGAPATTRTVRDLLNATVEKPPTTTGQEGPGPGAGGVRVRLWEDR